MNALIQYIGAALVLFAFSANAMGKVSSRGRTYLSVNGLGSGFLVVSAYQGSQWGFFILNVVWLLVSLVGLIRSGTSERISEA